MKGNQRNEANMKRGLVECRKKINKKGKKDNDRHAKSSPQVKQRLEYQNS